jgi:hypothetical protein
MAKTAKKPMTQVEIRARCVLALETQGRRVTPERIVEAAAALDHPMHDDFLWDNEAAGHKYRIEQARGYIAQVRIVRTTSTKTLICPGYVRDPTVLANRQGYIATQVLQTESEAAQAALQAEMVQLQARLERCRELASALDLESVFDSMLASVIDVRSRLRGGRGTPGIKPLARARRGARPTGGRAKARGGQQAKKRRA